MILSSFLILNTCKNDHSSFNNSIKYDLNEIKERGRLIAVTSFNSVDYFIYKGRPMGFQLDLLLDYAEYSGLQLEIKACTDIKEAYRMLMNGECDVIAMDLLQNESHQKLINYTHTIRNSDFVLVQNTANKENFISNLKQLDGKRIYVPRYSGSAEILMAIEEKEKIDIDIHQVRKTNEELITKVAENDIDYTISDRGVSIVNKKNYSNIDNSMAVSDFYNFTWATRKQSELLKSALNQWIDIAKKTSRYSHIYANYFTNNRTQNIVKSDYYVVSTGKLSMYDDNIKTYSNQLDWDWRLLASLIYSESKFNNQSRSCRGAYGLMQIMPITATHFGYDTIISPDYNLKVGVKLLKQLEKVFINQIPDKDERLKFVLASYNIGLGHILDARRLAEKYGKNPNNWDDVLSFLLKKSDKQFYSDPVVQHGRCVGKQTSKYVDNVLSIYMHYRNIPIVE